MENRSTLGELQLHRPVELSCKSEYALLALLELSLHYDKGEPLQIRQIAAQQNIPDRYLEQLLATLRRAGFVKSQRGAKGGYLLTQAPWNVSLLDVVNCIEGLEKKDNGSDAVQTTERQVVRSLWHDVQQAAKDVLSAHTLQDLVEQRNAKHQVDLMYYI
ncbi:RrF2 family transcriptional regulator [Leptolyngbya ectocarpi]|uniref:RrF2 family transcriptional regulator n=1 Tax=Leptolyngbya ectocarpi TaxID=1202 RepID=UPI002AD502FE|nr:Rrf2 family transcriptional regulator [Leptolyngbya ectocarpi]